MILMFSSRTELMLLVYLFFVPVENLWLLVAITDSDRQLKLCISLGSWDIYLKNFCRCLIRERYSVFLFRSYYNQWLCRTLIIPPLPPPLSASLHFACERLSQLCHFNTPLRWQSLIFENMRITYSRNYTTQHHF